jgi:hypothetical protein
LKQPKRYSQPQKKPPPKAPDRPWKPAVVASEQELADAPGVLRKADISALFAVSQGVANEDQQKRAIAAIHKIACTGDMEYRPDELGGDRDTAFAGGKRYVGLQLDKLIRHHAVYLKD